MKNEAATPPRSMRPQERCSPSRMVLQVSASPPKGSPPIVLHSKRLEWARGEPVEARMMVAPTADLRKSVKERPDMEAEAFHDVFLDTKDVQLGQAGCWLRSRCSLGGVTELVLQYPDEEAGRLEWSGVRAY